MTDLPTSPYSLYKQSLDLLHSGHLLPGFRLYENRYHPDVKQAIMATHDKHLPAPTWKGERLLGKTIVVQMEQGYGDVIQMARFLPMLKAWGAKEVYILQHFSLHYLMGQMECIDHISNDFKDPILLNADYWIGSMSLPYFAMHSPAHVRQLFPVTLNKIVGSEGYLDAKPSDIERKIGVNWMASKGHLHYAKSIPVQEMRRLLGADAYSLNYDGDDIFTPLPEGWKNDWYQTAQHMKAMRGVICPDTGTAHLAGALGVKCIMLLPDDPYVCWRWKHGKWYDSVVAIKPNEWDKIPDLLRRM
jgi:hypothetical protein